MHLYTAHPLNVKGIEKWVLIRMFGPKRREITGDWRKVHN
jgi:hypothetical protein